MVVLFNFMAGAGRGTQWRVEHVINLRGPRSAAQEESYTNVFKAAERLVGDDSCEVPDLDWTAEMMKREGGKKKAELPYVMFDAFRNTPDLRRVRFD